MFKRILLGAALLFVALGASPAHAQYNKQNFITCTPTSLPAGGTVTCTAGYFDPGTPVTWTLNSTPLTLGSTIVDSSGRASIAFQVPVGFELGAHTVVASGTALGQAVSLSVSAAITVGGATSATTTPSTTGSLPTTGSSDTWPLVLGAAVLISVGAFFVSTTRKQRHRARIDA